jgi:hypothetical protein
MVQSKATTVSDYLKSLPADRRAAIQAVRKVILENIDPGYQEQMQYGMIGYSVPHAVYPQGYHCDPQQPLPFAGLASQKNYMSFYLMTVYSDPKELAWFQGEWKKSGKKLDMGKSCIRFKSIDDLPLGVVGEAFARIGMDEYIRRYELSLSEKGGKKTTSKKK